jgi:uracil-DNA glycosylase
VSDDTQREKEVAEVAAEALRHLAWLAAKGIREVPEPALPRDAPPERMVGTREPLRASGRRPGHQGAATAGATASGRAPSTSPTATGTAADGPEPARSHPPTGPAAVPGEKGCGSAALAQIRADLGECGRCKLAGGRTHLVFGVGNPRAELMFVGEGPGADEDQQGEPFVGRAGQLLTKMIEAMGFRREEVYIANVVKCRPPGNRNPEPDEIEACEPFLRRQIEAIGPRVIVALGKFAAQTLLRDGTPITRLRGRWSAYGGVRLMPTFHPAYLLRSPDEKKKAWEDLQQVMKELGRTVPGR